MDITFKLKRLFDFQRFEGNEELQSLIDDTDSRCNNELADDDLEWVSAAGEETDLKDKKDGDGDE
ncbi:MAG: hypothetical protein ACI4MC_07100 [Candidatus Coproplasma sp.]